MERRNGGWPLPSSWKKAAMEDATRRPSRAKGWRRPKGWDCYEHHRIPGEMGPDAVRESAGPDRATRESAGVGGDPLRGVGRGTPPLLSRGRAYGVTVRPRPREPARRGGEPRRGVPRRLLSQLSGARDSGKPARGFRAVSRAVAGGGRGRHRLAAAQRGVADGRHRIAGASGRVWKTGPPGSATGQRQCAGTADREG